MIGAQLHVHRSCLLGVWHFRALLFGFVPRQKAQSGSRANTKAEHRKLRRCIPLKREAKLVAIERYGTLDVSHCQRQTFHPEFVARFHIGTLGCEALMTACACKCVRTYILGSK